MNNVLKSTFFLSLFTFPLVATGGAGSVQAGMIVTFIFAAAMNACSHCFSDKIAIRMYNAHEISREEHHSFHGVIVR
ncbi:MAG: hypothetical protein PHY09_06625 [Desulfuromonadaceae bacterium]|nr:hypothetical protein [Desulfuromonadaceae bacterium]MDD5104806.1 hypothetical protein [Desulfuromonadaceae bacterium]